MINCRIRKIQKTNLTRNDNLINELLDDNNNLQEKMILHDYGQGSLPYKGNCGFLTMSQFKFGFTNE